MHAVTIEKPQVFTSCTSKKLQVVCQKKFQVIQGCFLLKIPPVKRQIKILLISSLHLCDTNVKHAL